MIYVPNWSIHHTTLGALKAHNFKYPRLVKVPLVIYLQINGLLFLVGGLGSIPSKDLHH